MWRDGQKKHVYIYRMVAAGTIEEKVFERQLSKEGLAGVATNEQASHSVPRRGRAATFARAPTNPTLGCKRGPSLGTAWTRARGR